MISWVRFERQGVIGFGTLAEGVITPYAGNMFNDPLATDERLPLSAVRLCTPCQPGKFLGLWNNFHERAAKENLTRPAHPLYFVKTDNSYLGDGGIIRQPVGYTGPVVFEGELGIVIGRSCHNVTASEARQHVFGYTCVNDVTARGILRSDPTFVQWVRAKSFDTFGVFGPAIVGGIEPDQLVVRTRVNGVEKQNYPVADMFFHPLEIVSLISRDLTLNPGDLIQGHHGRQRQQQSQGGHRNQPRAETRHPTHKIGNGEHDRPTRQLESVQLLHR